MADSRRYTPGEDLAPLPRASLIIPSRNRPQLLRQSVRSILDGTVLPAELIIIDQSDSADATLAALDNERGCEIRYCWSSERGTSRARNAGLTTARYDIIAFTDDDVVVQPGWFEALVRAQVAAGPRTVVIGPVIPAVAAPGAFVPSTLVDTEPAVYRGRLMQDMLYTGNMALARDAVREIGMFDERLGPGTPFPAAEDNDFGFRLLERGYQIVYEPAAALYHLAWRDEREFVRLRWAYGRGQGAYYAKYLSLRDRHMLRRLGRHAKDHAVQALLNARRDRLKARGHAAYTLGLLAGTTGWWWRYGHGRRMRSRFTHGFPLIHRKKHR